jgi:hypothetical protein
MEQWNDIAGFEGYYKVSNTGRVISLNRFKFGRGRKKLSKQSGKELNLKTDKYGYLTVQLCKESIRKHITVHRLVALAFMQNPLNLPQINHKDTDKKNNNISNLEWCTAKENVIHAHANGKAPNVSRGRHGMAKLIINLHTGIFYDCAKDAADAHNLNHSKMKDIMRGRVKSITNFMYV